MTDIKIAKINTDAHLKDCLKIRTIVFVQEQNVSVEEEMDGLDNEADHYLLWVRDEPVATARVRLLSDMAKIERVAVLKSRRGKDIGRKLMEFIISDLKKNPAIRTLKLGAQVQVIPFYERLGFTAYGDEFLDAGIRHRWMTCPA
ncbi:hypothetical protein MNBD_ALPHA02-1561 [hydrothermal vent metagenome]|uniref:N-acetyltransferase domain-containing protein n=1 Tax=hydrothermal vent metagenome TaxID=652676 RepID=A0A3B0RNN4_9ZZZZ